VSSCRSCNAPVLWVATATGKQMPIDAIPVPDGNIILDTDRIAHVLPDAAQPPPDVLRYVSHFATCPNATQHRRREGRPAGSARRGSEA
jgi:hypothetical protein